MFIKIYTDSELEFFPLYLYTAELNHLQEKCARPDGYIHHHLFIIRSGHGIIKINNNTHTLSDGDMLYIEAGVPHEYYGITDDFTTDYMTFYGNSFMQIKEYYGLNDYGIYKHKNSRVFEGQLARLLDITNGLYELSTLSSFTYSAVISFFDEVYKRQYTPVEEVYRYLENNYSKPITLDDLLSIYPYSKSKLCSEFKAEYKHTIFEMLTQIRLKNAHYMLGRNPHLRITDIASDCGFNDASYFCRMYRKYYGVSPKQTDCLSPMCNVTLSHNTKNKQFNY